jgi:hypothetical protein
LRGELEPVTQGQTGSYGIDDDRPRGHHEHRQGEQPIDSESADRPVEGGARDQATQNVGRQNDAKSHGERADDQRRQPIAAHAVDEV